MLTNDGRVIMGIVVEDTPLTIALTTESGKTVRIARKDIKAFRTTTENFDMTVQRPPAGNSFDPNLVDRVTSTAADDVKQIEAQIEALALQVESLRAQLKGSKESRTVGDARAKVRVQIQALGIDADSPDFFGGSIFWIEEPFDHRLVLREMKAAQKGGRQVIRVAFTTDGNRATTVVGDLIKKLRAAGFDDIEYVSSKNKE